ncbi:DUF3953 domain-containing protein [Peribacillus frigoritolerans]|jgi:hypothetical protein|uniref:DUF3953 domain-containing protein n=1 Tax=Peribacillus frigoritolerans TaxID=450367 RepID=UPI00209D91ED|nr:DUF3953 domain-containing protein [Peribacillus frigoritolerans]MCP1493194.1 hypothetical protein [Peribacillus frigoritolerans]
MVRIILAIVVIVLSSYSLITKSKTELMPYCLFFLGALILVTGFAELQKSRKGFVGYMSIVVSLFVFFVSIKVFLLH